MACWIIARGLGFLGIVEETTGSISCMTRGLSCTRGVQKMGCVVQDLIDFKEKNKKSVCLSMG